MAAPGDIAGMRREAYQFAYSGPTYQEGFATTRFYNPWMDRENLVTAYDKAYTRASRVHYMLDSNQGWYFNRDKVGCPEGGNYLSFNYSVSFSDEDGNRFEQFYNATVPLNQHIGQNNDAARNDVVAQVRDRYFAGKSLEEVRGLITSIRLTNVRCLVS